MRSTQSKESLYSVTSDAPCSETFAIGDRVKAGGERLGRVAFVGTTEFEAGQWIGIVLDKPEGKNNGSVKGKAYFECTDKHGIFCRPNKLVKVQPRRQRFGSPTQSIASSIAPSIAASQVGGGSRKEHSPFASEYGYDINERVVTADGRAGKLKFLNVVPSADGQSQVYAGIIFDKPVGDSDGKFQGILRFNCYPKYATFLPADQVKRATRTVTALPPKIAPKQTTSSRLRLEKGAEGVAGTGTNVASSLRGSMDSLDSIRSPPLRSGISKQTNSLIRDKEVDSLKKYIREKEVHLAQLTTELEERRCDSERLAQENRSLKLRVGEVQARLGEVEKENVKLELLADERKNKLEDLSFCNAEAEVQKEELMLQLNELRCLRPVIEVEDEMEMEAENELNMNITAGTGGGQAAERTLLLEASIQTESVEIVAAESGQQAQQLAKMFSHLQIQTEPVQSSHFAQQTEEQLEEPKAVMTMANADVQTDENSWMKRSVTRESAVQTSKQSETESSGVQTEDSKPAEPEKPMIKVELIDASIQTEATKNGAAKAPTKHSTAQTDSQITPPIPPAPVVPVVQRLTAFSQTELPPQRASSSQQTDETVEKPRKKVAVETVGLQTEKWWKNGGGKCVDVQTEPEPEPIPVKTEPPSVPVLIRFIEAEVQTDDSRQENNNNANVSSSHSSPSSNSNNNKAEVVELNVMQLPFNAAADISTTGGFPLTSGQQNSPNTQLQRKYEEKCEDVERLQQQTSFLNTIIADQQNTIDQLKRMNLEGPNNSKNNSSQNKAQPAATASSVTRAQRSKRLYCEHCELFDYHSSEDCPKQEAREAEKRAHVTVSPTKRS